MTEVLYHSVHGNCTVQRTWDRKSRNFEGKPEMLSPIPFVDGWCKLDDQKDADVIEDLDGHKGNIANGGSSFKKMKSDILGLKAIEDGRTYACSPDEGISDSDKETFKYLSELPASLPPNTFNKALNLAVDIYERYGVVGVPKPSSSFKQKRLRACIVEIIATIEEQGIWHDDIHGEDDTGSGSKED